MKVERKYVGSESHYTITGLEVGEPIFVLRGRDPLALQILMDYERSMDGLGILSEMKKALLQDLAKDFVKYGATAQLRFPD
ncbi:hypothetical protein LCGC14_1148010 [marine sediment metagenome]|uniref:Uncharacterized protein n=1 Tax=marine sediment metagenome TaxID=412755 RepID=A0A0F9M1B8_9ZZZZ